MTATAEDLRALIRDDDENVFEDEQLDAALLASGGNLLRAAGFAFQALAAEYIMLGRSTKTDDLAIDTRGRGTDLNAVAKSYFEQANAADSAEANDAFVIVPLPPRAGRTRNYRPEGTPCPL